MPKYDEEHFSPAAPIANVILRNPATKNTISDVEMLVDTGADITLIPRLYVNKLNLEIDFSQSYQVIGFDGNASFAQSAFVEILLLKKTFKGRFLIAEQNQGVLGRDILNLLSLVFDRPNLFWEERKFFSN
ncbi:MAG: retroviral-like aspartic protease [Blastocatellia bacterium]|nr:retroviral-like aspartic protease [Blastocatellia bacterium]